jgi:hypothetical protein
MLHVCRVKLKAATKFLKLTPTHLSRISQFILPSGVLEKRKAIFAPPAVPHISTAALLVPDYICPEGDCLTSLLGDRLAPLLSRFKTPVY